jgi:hypothetical protein
VRCLLIISMCFIFIALFLLINVITCIIFIIEYLDYCLYPVKDFLLTNK